MGGDKVIDQLAAISPMSAVYKAHGDIVAESEEHGERWAEEAATVLIGIAVESKKIARMKDENVDKETGKTAKTLRNIVTAISKPFLSAIAILEDVDKKLRQRLVNEYGEDREIVVKDEGVISFRKKWECEVSDEKLVPARYRSVNMATIQSDVDMGVRNIPGVNIYEKRIVVVKADKE